MDFERLREFSLAAKCGSIKAAAELLSLSPATLGARLRVLERSLGVALFAHMGRRVRLTPEGERLLPYAADILRRYDSVTSEVKAIRHHHYRQLRIGISGEWPLFHIGPFLDKINLTHPQIELSLYDDQAMPLLDALCRNELDICFASILESADLAGMARVPISSCNPCISLPRTHPFNLRGSLSLRELEGETFLLYPPTDALGTRCFQLASLSACGIRHSTYDLACSPMFRKLFGPIGKGILLLPSPQFSAPPNAVSLSLTDVPCPAPLCFVYNPRSPNPDVPAFVSDFMQFIEVFHQHDH